MHVYSQSTDQLSPSSFTNPPAAGGGAASGQSDVYENIIATPKTARPTAAPVPVPPTGRTENEILSKPELAKVMFPYEPTSDTELKLRRGLLVQVHQKHSSGWWEGEIQVCVCWCVWACVCVLCNRYNRH